jgi:spermidine/putrescine-binding protein
LVGLVGFVAVVAGGCGSGSGHDVKSKTLNLYTWTRYVPPQVIAGFERRHLGLTVHVSYYASNEALLANVLAHPGTYDVVIPSDYMIEIMIRRHLLESIDVARDLRNFSNVAQDFRTPAFDPGDVVHGKKGKAGEPKYTVPYQWGTTGIIYDSSKVLRPPKTWSDLARAQFRGKVALIDDAREVLGAGLLVNGHSKDDSSAADIGQALAWVKSLKPQPVNANRPEQPLIEGKAVVGVIYNGDAFQAIHEDPSLRYVLPPQGGIWFDNLAIPKDAPHRDAALAFIDYLLSGSVSADVSKAYGYSTPNAAALDALAKTDPAFVRSSVSNPPRDALFDLLLTKDVGTAGSARFEAAWKQIVP